MKRDARRLQALIELLAVLRFVELNLIAARKIVKKRDKVAGRTGGRPRTPTLLGGGAGSPLASLEALEPQCGALFAAARRLAEARGTPSPPTCARAYAAPTATAMR